VSIANGALQLLGAKRIESLTQDHPNARSMNNAFDRVRDAELRRYDWSFAIKRASIAADADGVTWGDWNAFAIPNDFLRLLRDDESGVGVDWKIEGRFILTADSAPLDIRYVARIDDVSLYDSLFIDTLVAKLAVVTCQEITQSSAKQEKVNEAYTFALNEAKKLGAIEKPAQEFPQDDWLTARL
jgi:hypothetical protein